jgi:hypothetical protein
MSQVHSAIRLYRDKGSLPLSRRATRKFLWNQPYFSDLPPRVVWALYEFRCRFLPEVSDANPLRIRWVKPEDIEYYHGDGPAMFGAVQAGEWDTPACKFRETRLFRSLETRFDDGADWESTPLYQEYAGRMRTANPYWRCCSPRELDAYFEGIDDLYDRIRRDGYRTQRELLNKKPDRTQNNTSDTPHPLLEEVCVNVYRDGTLAKKRCGNHRLAIAKLLDLDEIPVLVLVRHADWQQIRNEIRTADSLRSVSDHTYGHLDHPDLADIGVDREALQTRSMNR